MKRCLSQSTFPDGWKTADVVIIKKGPEKDPSLPKSYRPVSLLPVCSKVLKRLIVTRLEHETATNMCKDKHGFMQGKSTISAIKDCLAWTDSRKERLVVGVFLDISGAFDNLEWRQLIEDVIDLGASESTRSVIESYLTGRKATLTIEKSTAKALITRGCPQGSQLGPALWKISMDKALKIVKDE